MLFRSTHISIACDPQTGFVTYDAIANALPIVITPQVLPIETIAAQISLGSFILLIALAFLNKFWNRSGKPQFVRNLP